MIMSDVASIVATVLAALLAMPCIALLYGTFFPGFARRAELKVTRNPILTFVTGLFVTGLVMGFALILAQGNAAFKFLSAIVAMGGGWAALSGMSGIAARIGHATSSPVDKDRPWRAIVRGSVILEMACLFPLVGWLLIYPIALVLGMGAAALALIPSAAPQAAPLPVQ
ncbi:MAG: hypothetical protein FD180_3391, partial [Planctomycetota bacterium]